MQLAIISSKMVQLSSLASSCCL